MPEAPQPKKSKASGGASTKDAAPQPGAPKNGKSKGAHTSASAKKVRTRVRASRPSAWAPFASLRGKRPLTPAAFFLYVVFPLLGTLAASRGIVGKNDVAYRFLVTQAQVVGAARSAWLDKPPFRFGDKTVAPGTMLFNVDDAELPRDVLLQFPNDMKNAQLVIWDCGVYDGDAVQLFVNGEPAGEPFNLTRAPRVVNVPTGAVIDVLAVSDQGDGVTYAMNFPQLSASVVNMVKAQYANRYELRRTSAEGAEASATP